MKKIFLLLNGAVATGTINDCYVIPQEAVFQNDVPTSFRLKDTYLTAGDTMVEFTLNSVPTAGLGERGGWNYKVFRTTGAPSETRATKVITVTNGGTNADTVTIAVGSAALGVATSAGGSAAALAILIATAINNAYGTSGGFEATVSGAAVTIIAPVGSGATLNGTAVTLTLSGGATIAITNTGSFAGGVAYVVALTVTSSLSQDPRAGIASSVSDSFTITNGGTNADTITAKVTTRDGIITLGTATSAGGSATALATLLTTAINAGGTQFTATSLGAVVTVTSPTNYNYLVGTGVTFTLSAAATITVTNTGTFAIVTPSVNANIVDLGTAILAYQASQYHV